MARFEFRLPDIGEGVTEGEVVAWGEGVAPGAKVAVDQILAEIMTDKATVTIPSPKAGVVAQLGAKVGEVVAVGAVLIVLETDASASSKLPTVQQEPVQQGPAATAAGTIPEQLPGMGAAPMSHQGSAGENERPLAAPATRKLARELGVDLRRVIPSGPHGRVTQDDVRSAAGLASPSTVQAIVPTPAPATTVAQERDPIRIAPSPSGGQVLEERVPLRGVRKTIFHQMARSKHTAAHFTFVEECDVTALKASRDRLRPLAETQGVKLSFLPFIVKACVAALKKHPLLNAAFDESTQEIVFRKYYNIGIAAATEAGLVVPVVQAVDSRSILEVAADIQRLGDAARTGKIRREDMVGSTFTITSLGAQGGLFATPILNFPEVAILGVHQIKEKPVVRNGQIVIGQVMLLSLSFDHRLIDGHVGAAFAYEVIGYLENPDKLMLEMV